LKYFGSPQTALLALPRHNADSSAKPKEPFLANALNEILLTIQIYQMYYGKFEIANK